MSLKFSGIESAGYLEKERVVLTAKEDCDIGDYAIFVSRANRDQTLPMSGPISDAYWFRDLSVKKGDIIVVYTKDGRSSAKVNENTTTSHFFYWRKRSPIWITGAACVLLHSDAWSLGKLFTGIDAEADYKSST